MVDTVRTLSALQTLLADNTAGDISAQDIRDLLVSVYPTVVMKSANESVTSSTTLQDDDELKFTGQASTSYALLALLMTDGATAGDIKANFNVPADADGTGAVAVLGPGTGASTFEDATVNNQGSAVGVGSATGYPAGTVGAGNTTLVILFGSVTMTAAGEIAVAWAQRASSVTASRVLAGSVLVGLPVNT